jgi:hypothetical protein
MVVIQMERQESIWMRYYNSGRVAWIGGKYQR